jgi:hypothetical protein
MDVVSFMNQEAAIAASIGAKKTWPNAVATAVPYLLCEIGAHLERQWRSALEAGSSMRSARNTLLAVLFLLPMTLSMSGQVPSDAEDRGFFGRWAVTLPDGRAGWMEVTQMDGWIDGLVLWGSGAVRSFSSVVVQGNALTLTRTHELPRLNQEGEVVRRQLVTETIRGKLSGDVLHLEREMPRVDGRGFDRASFIATRIPALPPTPDVSQLVRGDPVYLFNGVDLNGWRLTTAEDRNAWVVENGVLAN